MAKETAPATEEPDMIAQVGEMLARLSNGEWSTPAMEAMIDQLVDPDINFHTQVDNTSVLASAILAVAAELRGVRNELSDWTRAWIARQ
jgi:hypothetical protein